MHRIVLLPAPQAAVLNEAGQVSQGDWSQQGGSGLIYPRIGFQMRDEEIGRGPPECYDPAESQPY
jgi:hypothetical protein